MSDILSYAPQQVLREASRIMGSDPAHGWPHVIRVARNAKKILEESGLANVNLEVLATAIALHDVGRFLPGDDHHALKSAVYARSLLTDIGWDQDRIESVAHAIIAHSYSLGVEPKTIEAIILSDADKLDALGAVGIARVFHTGCQLSRDFQDSLRHFKDKILKLPDLVMLEVSRRIAKERVEIVIEFLKAAKREGMMRLDEADPPLGGGEEGRRH